MPTRRYLAGAFPPGRHDLADMVAVLKTVHTCDFEAALRLHETGKSTCSNQALLPLHPADDSVATAARRWRRWMRWCGIPGWPWHATRATSTRSTSTDSPTTTPGPQLGCTAGSGVELVGAERVIARDCSVAALGESQAPGVAVGSQARRRVTSRSIPDSTSAMPLNCSTSLQRDELFASLFHRYIFSRRRPAWLPGR